MSSHFFATSLIPQAPSPARGPTIQRSGSINTETWTNQRVEITGDVLVASGQDLTIGPGTEVVFMGDYAIEALGGIQAIGTPSQRITFAPNTGQTKFAGVLCGRFGQVKPDQTKSFVFQYCDFSKGDKTTARGGATWFYTNVRGGALCAWDPLSLLVDNCTFAENKAGANGSGGALYVNGDSSVRSYTVSNCTFTDNQAGTINAHFKIDHGQNHIVGPNNTYNGGALVPGAGQFQNLNCTVYTASDLIDVGTSHFLVDGMEIRFTAGTPPSGITLNRDYFAVAAASGGSSTKIAETRADALAGTFIDLSDTGTNLQAQVLYHWMCFDSTITILD